MVSADPAFAKVDVDKLTIGGEIRERYEVRTNSAMNVTSGVGGGNSVTGNKGNESTGSHRVRVNVGYDLTPDVSFFAQIQDARYFGTECASAQNTTGGAQAVNVAAGAACVSTANATFNGIDLHQGYIQLKNVLVPGLSLKAGRQEVIFGDHRLFGNFGWSQIGNAFDGVRLTHATSMVDIDLLWLRIVDNFATTSTANGQPAILFPGASTVTQSTSNQDVYVAYVTLKPIKNWTIEPYFILLSDARPAAGPLGGGNAINTAQATAQTRHFLGGRLNGKAGGLDFTYEGNYQFGSIASTCMRNPTAANCGTFSGQAGTTFVAFGGNRDAHLNAHQHALRTGFTFEPVPMKPRIGFEADYASGDSCQAGPRVGDNNQCGGSGNHFNTADNLYPTNHFHYGYMDLMSWKNMVAYMVMFDVKPSPVSKLQFNFWWMRLAQAEDNWYRAGQATYFASKATNQAASLGRELDVHYWHTFKEKFKFEVGYGHFWAGEYLRKSVGPECIQFGGTQGSASQGLNCNANQSLVGQNWGYVMGSILF
jgi:hypothetical protein